MEVIIRIEKGFYPKHHLVQLHRKPITTTKALQKNHSPFSFISLPGLTLRTQTNDDH